MSNSSLRDDVGREDLEKLQGIWRTVAVEVDGTSIPSWQFENSTLVIVGDRFILANPQPDAEQRTEGVFKLDARTVPKELNLTLDNGQVIEEIYELKETALKVCYSIKGGRRPKHFNNSPQSGISVVVYERESRP